MKAKDTLWLNNTMSLNLILEEPGFGMLHHICQAGPASRHPVPDAFNCFYLMRNN